MLPSLPLLLSLGQTSGISPRAKCPNAYPGSAACCYKNHAAPVLGGVDFVDLATKKKQGTDAPAMGLAAHVEYLNGYPFHFATADNAKIFAHDPWAFAPSWGGF